MSDDKKRDGIPNIRIAGTKGFTAVAAFITIVFGGPIVDWVDSFSNSSRDILIRQIHELETTVATLEHGITNINLVCTPDMKVVASEPKPEDEFYIFDEFDLWP